MTLPFKEIIRGFLPEGINADMNLIEVLLRLDVISE